MKSNKRVMLFSSLAVALAASVALTGCGSSSSTPSTTKSVTDNKVDGGDIIYGSLGEPTTFNPFFATDQSSADVYSLVFDSLYNMSNKITPYPQLAASMPTISPDGLSWTIKLRNDVKFSDGQPMTADDVVFTFQIPMSKDYQGPRKSDFDAIKSVEKVDDYTVKFTLKNKYAPFITEVLPSYPILPKHLLQNVAIKDMEKNDFFKNHPVGTGPFKFVEWKSGQYLKFVRNDNYFLKKPSVNTITYKIVPDANAMLAQLQSGELNMTSISATLVKTAQQLSKSTNKFQVLSTEALQYVYVGWNNKNPLFSDPIVRQALTTALDRQSIVDNILNGNGKVANVPVSDLMTWAYDPNAPHFDYDINKAKDMLKQEGWTPGPDGILQKDGKKFEFTLLTNQGNKVREQIATYMQQQYKQLGIQVTPRIVEWSAFNNQYIQPGKYDAAVEAWGTGTDPDLTPIFSSSSVNGGLNFNFYKNAQVDALNTQNLTELDQTKRGDIIKKAEDLIAQDQTYSFLYYPKAFLAVPANLQGVDYGPNGDLFNVQNWYFTK